MFLQTDQEMEVVGEATNGRDAVEITMDRKPDLIVMDLLMPEMDGVAATRSIRQQQPDINIIALSSSTDYGLITSSLLAGASSYLHKGSKPDLLLTTIKGVTAGRVLLSRGVMDRVLNYLPAPDDAQPLTPTEVELLRLLSSGYSDNELEQRLQMKTSAIRSALEQTQHKLSSNTRLLAVLRAIQLGLIERLTPA